MTWRLKISHKSGYQYQSPVHSSYNEARITPLTTDKQLTIESRVEIDPPPTRPFRYWDYWGTLVHAFDLHQPHTELIVTGTSVVETGDEALAPAALDWDELDSRSAELTEYLSPTPHVPLTDLPTAVRELRSCSDPAGAAREAADWVRSTMSYEPGATLVSTSATEALAAGRGVCQDFVHVFLALCRALGIPARYVSGYLHPALHADIGTTDNGEGHAWAEVWVGEWMPIDPTNGELPGPRHVLVARGRDYRDVAPLRGVYSGGAAHALDVEVALTRMA